MEENGQSKLPGGSEVLKNRFLQLQLQISKELENIVNVQGVSEWWWWQQRLRHGKDLEIETSRLRAVPGFEAPLGVVCPSPNILCILVTCFFFFLSLSCFSLLPLNGVSIPYTLFCTFIFLFLKISQRQCSIFQHLKLPSFLTIAAFYMKYKN